MSNFFFRILVLVWVLLAVVVFVEGEDEFLLDKDIEGRNKNLFFIFCKLRIYVRIICKINIFKICE